VECFSQQAEETRGSFVSTQPPVERASPIHVGRDPIALTIGLGGVWVSDLGERLALRRIDVNTGRTTAGPFRAPGRSGRADSLAVAGRRVWTTNAYGIASRIDPKTGSRAGRPIRIP